MNRDSIEFPTLFVYTMMSNIVSIDNNSQKSTCATFLKVVSNFESILRTALIECAFKAPNWFLLTICLLQFVVIFAASMHRPGFYHMDSPHDHLLIGQLYYINFFALFMGYEMTMQTGFEIYKAKYQQKWLHGCRVAMPQDAKFSAAETHAPQQLLSTHTHTHTHTLTHPQLL